MIDFIFILYSLITLIVIGVSVRFDKFFLHTFNSYVSPYVHKNKNNNQKESTISKEENIENSGNTGSNNIESPKTTTTCTIKERVCPTPKCGTIFSYENVTKNNPEFPKYICNRCGKHLCFNCDDFWHQNQTCNDYKSRGRTSVQVLPTTEGHTKTIPDITDAKTEPIQSVNNTFIVHNCPYPSCDGVTTVSNPKEKKILCSKCKRNFCATCKSSWHEGRTCEEWKQINHVENDEIAKMIKHHEVVKCPRCQALVSKEDKQHHLSKHATCPKCSAEVILPHRSVGRFVKDIL